MGTSFIGKHIKLIEFFVVDVLEYYNWFAPMPKAVAAVSFVCDALPSACLFVKNKILHLNMTVDNLERFDVFISNEPSGQSYRTFIYYIQQSVSGRTALYDYGKIKNKQLYGSTEAPLVPFENYTLPTALMSGALDHMAPPADVSWIADQLGDNIVFKKQYNNDHFTFALGKDMTFFSVDAVDLLKEYN